jgi:hypothetical protein
MLDGFAAAVVAILCMSIMFLRVGHTHEDIDALVGLLMKAMKAMKLKAMKQNAAGTDEEGHEGQ